MREKGKVPHFLATDSEFVQHQLMDCVAVTRVTVHLDTVAYLRMHWALVTTSIWKPEIQLQL